MSDDEQWVLTGKGAAVALGILEAFSEGHDIDQVAALNGIEPDVVRTILVVVAASAGLIEPLLVKDDE